MKQGFKLLTVLLLTLLLTVSATAQINWMKQDGNVKYLAWDNGLNSKNIYNGNSANFATGYFGSTISQTVHLTVTINSKDDGKIVSTIVSKDVKVANTLGYQVITVLPEDYKNKVGEYIIVIKLKDANTELVDSSLYLNVKSNLVLQDTPPVQMFVNNAPDMKNIPNKEVSENNLLQFTVSATDKDNDKIEYSGQVCGVKFGSNCLYWNNINFVGASLNKDTGKFTWTPNYDFVKHPSLSRNIDFRFRANDGEKKSDWEQITVTVNDVNRNPLFNIIGNKAVQEEQLLMFTITAVDLDNDELEYSVLSVLPPGASLDKDTGKFKWTPTDEQAGVYPVTFKVVDKLGNKYFGGKDIETIIITVTDLVVDKPQCDDGVDNDGDGKIDFPNDPGCTDKNDDNETDDPVDLPQCNDGVDNDGDGKADENDPGCHSDGNPNNPGTYDQTDDNETDDPVDLPQCNDGIDNDGDGKIDFPNDPGCTDKNDDNETDDPVDLPQCNDGVDNDGDGKADENDPGCHSDGNPNNPGTYDQTDDNETDDPVDLPQCNDGVDNDGDGKADFPNDPGCTNKNDDDETDAENPPVPSVPFPFTNIKFKSVTVEDTVLAGNLMIVNVNIFNNGKTNLEDVEIQATIYEEGIFGSTSDFSLLKNKGVSKIVSAPIPEEVQPGWYIIKITAKNSHYHTSTYRLVHITSNTFQ
ncbi:MAG: putative Ig domain-containing protein [Nanoarchaeota archaeon]